MCLSAKVISLQETGIRLIFFMYFYEGRIARMVRKSNRFLVSLFCLFFLFFCDFFCASSGIWTIKIIHLVDIDNLPPLPTEIIPHDDRDSSNYQVCLSREHHVCESYDIPERDDTIDDERIDDTEIEAHEEEDKECHHQEHIIESFHSIWDYASIVSCFIMRSK